MKRFVLPILILIVSLLIAYQILSVWRGVHLNKPNPVKEDLLKAIKITPSNPDPYYRLGLLYQYDIRNINLKESIRYLRKAIERNPLEQEYWLGLGRAFQRMGEKNDSEEALEKAISLFPTGFRGRWVTANLLLQQGTLEKALLHFTYLLAGYPNQSGSVYDVLFKAINDPGFILEKVVPKDPTSMNQYVAYLYEIGDRGSVKKAWEKKVSYGFKSDRNEALRHIDFLISHGELRDAFEVWKGRLREEKIPVPADGNLMTNGGFEKEKILGGGFDWKIGTVPGAEISFDPVVFQEGERSLKVVFSGKENVDFHHVFQYVPLRPNTDYVLKAQMKTKEITTKSGLRLEISGIGSSFYKTTESLTGDSGWKEMAVSFRTPNQIQGGLVRMRRDKSEKFDRFISGTLWLDRVSLTETQ